MDKISSVSKVELTNSDFVKPFRILYEQVGFFQVFIGKLTVYNIDVIFVDRTVLRKFGIASKFMTGRLVGEICYLVKFNWIINHFLAFSVTILIHNVSRDVFVLVKQFRPGSEPNTLTKEDII